MKMRVTLKPLRDQVVVLTGASSGIGLATARLAASRGARLVLAARSEDALSQLVAEIEANGGEAISVVADLSREEDVGRIAEAAIARFGGFDTWINNAGIGLYGALGGNNVEDMRRLFEINFWGIVYGSREALKHLRQRSGALINLGSVVSERAVPLQGMYSASKHAIKGFTEALRMELEHEGAPVSVTLIKPGQIDTPFTTNARNNLGSEPHHVPPVYAPDVVARAILHAAEKPVRDVFAGGGGRLIAALGHLVPGVTDRLMETVIIPGTPSGRPPRRARDRSNLDGPTESLVERGNYEGRVRKTSLYTQARLHPWTAAAAMLGSVYVLNRLFSSDSHRPARFSGRKGSCGAKALHVRLEARRGREADVEKLLQGILASVRQEPGTRPWFGLRRSRSVFEIFETFPSESARKAHLAGEGAALLIRQSNLLLRRPAEISRLDMLMGKS